MPLHSYIHDESGETIDVFVEITAPNIEHQRQIVGERTFRRVYEPVHFCKDARTGDATKEDYLRKTQDKRGVTLQEMANISKEFSEQRAARDGVDGVKEQFYKTYEKDMGAPHKDVVKRDRKKKAQESLKKFGVNVKV